MIWRSAQYTLKSEEDVAKLSREVEQYTMIITVDWNFVTISLEQRKCSYAIEKKMTHSYRS